MKNTEKPWPLEALEYGRKTMHGNQQGWLVTRYAPFEFCGDCSMIRTMDSNLSRRAICSAQLDIPGNGNSVTPIYD